MTDDLVKRLRNPPFGTETSERNVMHEAADRIEDLQLKVGTVRLAAKCVAKILDDRIEKLEAALQKVLARCSWYEITLYNDVEEIIRKALEGKDD